VLWVIKFQPFSLEILVLFCEFSDETITLWTFLFDYCFYNEKECEGNPTKCSGYIQCASPLKRSEGKGVSYLDGEKQTGKDDIRRFVSFSPETLDTFESAVALKEAVTLINPRFTVNRRKT
jgi:hypothetical protein